VVIAQRLRPLGFDGGLSILKEYLHSLRISTQAQRAILTEERVLHFELRRNNHELCRPCRRSAKDQ
jgi:hypothetical protein